MKASRYAGALATVVALAVILTACAGPDRRTFEFSGPTMGSTFSVKVVTGSDGLSGEAQSELDQIIRADLERINTLMSTWDPDSELSRFNQSTSTEPLAISQETFDVFEWAQALAELTDGALDVTMVPLLAAWGFGPAGPQPVAPSEARITTLLEAAGMRYLRLDEAAGTVQKTRPEVACDFSSLAPGYAADLLSTRLSDRGFQHFLVDVGGELRARGTNDADQPWQIAVERPQREGRAIERMVPLVDQAIATSGDYRNYHEVDGRRVTHILDPRTGRPIEHRLASVTVIDDLAVRADGLATAMMVLGPVDGLALADRLELAALFIVREADGSFTERTTLRFDQLAKQ